MKRTILASTFLSLAACTHAFAQEEAEVIHWWTSGGESKAVSVIAQAFNAAGGEWVDQAVAGGSAARLAAINAIGGGQPPIAAQFNTSKQFRELIDGGLLAELDAVAAEQDWDKILPEPTRSVIKIDGHYYAIPVAIHMPTWIWYSKPAFEKAGITAEPKNRDEFFAALDSLKEAGLTALAFGGQPWQERLVFNAMLMHFGGRDLYSEVYGEEGVNAVDTPEFRQVLADYKHLKDYTDAGSANRSWNETTAMLIKGEAGIQIMGDWAKGEFSAAGLTAGKEFGCIAGFGEKSPYMVEGDVFIFPKIDDEAQEATQIKLAKLILTPEVQIEFSKYKGSIPARIDLDGSSLDICAQTGMKIVADPTRQLPSPPMLLPPDIEGSVTDIITNFWNTDQSVDDAVAALQGALQR